MANIVDVTVKVSDKASAGLAEFEATAKESGHKAGGSFSSEFDKATGDGKGLMGALFGKGGSSVITDAERAGQQAGQGLGKGLEQKFNSTLGTGLLSGLLGTSGGTKLFSGAGNTVVQDAARQGESIAQGLAEGIDQGLGSASGELGSIGSLLSGIGSEDVTPTIEVSGLKAAESEIDSLGSGLQDISGGSVGVSVTGAGEAETQVSALDGSLDEFGHKRETATVAVSGAASAATELEAVKRSASDAGGESQSLSESLGVLAEPMTALIAAGVVLSPVLITAGIGIGGFAGAAYGAAKPILAAAQATGGLKANMDTLDPAQQKVASGILGLQSQYEAFSKALQPEVFSAFNSGIGIAKGLLTDVEPVAAAAGGAIDNVLAALGGDLHSGEWQQFFGWMAANAGPDIQQLGGLVLSLANDIPVLAEDLQPFAQGLLSVATASAQAAGALAAMEPVVSKTSGAAAAAGSNSGGFMGLIDKGKMLVGEVTGLYKPSSDAANAIDSVGQKAGTAASAVGAMSGPVATLGSALSGAATDTTALDTAWNTLVGNFNSADASYVSAEQAVQSYAQAIKTSGASSLAAQAAFYSSVSSIQSVNEAEAKNHDPASKMYADNQSLIASLKAKGPLNSTEASDLKKLQAYTNELAETTDGMTAKQKALSSSMASQFSPQLVRLGLNSKTAKGDIGDLTNAIINTGAKSEATSSARAKLISDIESTGATSTTAQRLVGDLEGQIAALHGKTVSVNVNAGEALAEVHNVQAAINGMYGKTIDNYVITNDIIHTSGGNLGPTIFSRAGGGAVPGAAGGGVRGGMVLVGEHGPEMVRLPGGSTVRSNSDTQSALAMGGSGGGLHITLELGDSFKRAGLTASQLEDIRYTVRTVGGGSPAKAFGKAGVAS